MINKLVEKIRKTGAPIVVGLDPMLSYIPQHVQEKAFAEYGETLEGAAERRKHLRSMERLWRELRKQSGSSTRKSWTRLTT